MISIKKLAINKNPLPFGEGWGGALGKARGKVFLFFLIFSLSISAGNNISKDDITVKRERVFIEKGLYGFMNGGADLFLEYGVRKLVTRDLVYLDMEYTLDIYEMPTPEDAYGIYSVHIFKCLQADTDDGINCLSTYQLQTIVSNYYISLVFTSGSEKARTNAKVLLQHYAADIKGDNIVFPEQIKASLTLPYSGVLKFLRGRISISGAQLSLANMLQGVRVSGVWFFPSDKEDEKRAFIIFNDEESANSFLEKTEPDDIVGSAGTWVHIRCRETKKPEEDKGPFGF